MKDRIRNNIEDIANMKDTKRKCLSLDSIMVLKVGLSDPYRVTMISFEQGTNNERVLLSSGESEKDVIATCLEKNQELERISIKKHMPSDYIEIYNEALNTDRFDICLTMLRGLESHMNQTTAEREKLMLKRVGETIKNH